MSVHSAALSKKGELRREEKSPACPSFRDEKAAEEKKRRGDHGLKGSFHPPPSKVKLGTRTDFVQRPVVLVI